MDCSVGAVEYANQISEEGENSAKVCLIYVIKQSDGEASVMLEIWRMHSTPAWPSLNRFTLCRCGNTR